MKKNKILVIGSSGQIGTDLCLSLERIYGAENIICSDLNPPKDKNHRKNFIKLDVLDNEMLTKKVKEENISEIYLLAASLSALAEKNVLISWELNMNSLINVLELARKKIIKKIFWPSSIAVFGPDSPKLNTPQNTTLNPSSIYGITKLAGEKLCQYYYDKFDVDVRSLRLPGLIGWRSLAGGGTTDYAVEIFYHALKNNDYTCFLSKETILPMMYMDDAIEAILKIMTTKKENIKIRTSYNISAVSFTPKELEKQIKIYFPNFNVKFKPDYRQKIADSWPDSIDDQEAKVDWGWKAKFNLEKLTSEMFKNLSN
jgi:nucleoside-diphosphate-sugar epimerase